MTTCACGGTIYTANGEAGYPVAVIRHQQTEQHRTWADGPAFDQWQNQATMKGQIQ